MGEAAAPDAARAARAHDLTTLELFAATAPGLAEFAAGELVALGLEPRIAPDGVEFTGDLAALACANVWLRTASRVLVRVAAFRARTFAELERHAGKVQWGGFIGPGVRPVFRVTSRKSRLYHTGAIDERLAAVIGAEVDGTAEQLFVVRGVRDEWTISADASGEHLHRRGYRLAVGKAPIRETIAAAAVLAARWMPDKPLVDPFCGSGTIPIEAAMIALRLAPGGARSFAFERWSKDAAQAADVARKESRQRSAGGAIIEGSDRDAGAVESARANAERAGVASIVRFTQAPLSAVEAHGSAGCVVTNPPYGVRVGDSGELTRLYRAFGDVMRERFRGWTVAMVSGDPRLDGVTRLALETRARTTNGGIPVRVMVGTVS